MAGRMNWSRVAKERVIQERGHEPLARKDRAIVQGRLAEKVEQKKKVKPKTPEQLAAEQAAREKQRIAGRERAKKQAEIAQRKQEERARAQLARKQEEARRKAELEQLHAEHRARFEAKLAAMTPEERKAYFENQTRPRGSRRQVVIVEHRPLEKPAKAGREKSPR